MPLSSEQITSSATADTLPNGDIEKKHSVNGNAGTRAGTGEAAMASFQILTTEYRAIATKNAARLSAMALEFTHAKSPVELMVLQQKVIAETFQTAIADSSQIAKLTTEMFSAAVPSMLRHFVSPVQLANKRS